MKLPPQPKENISILPDSPCAPFYARNLPRFTSHFIVMSRNGSFQFTDGKTEARESSMTCLHLTARKKQSQDVKPGRSHPNTCIYKARQVSSRPNTCIAPACFLQRQLNLTREEHSIRAAPGSLCKLVVCSFLSLLKPVFCFLKLTSVSVFLHRLN